MGDLKVHRAVARSYLGVAWQYLLSFLIGALVLGVIFVVTFFGVFGTIAAIRGDDLRPFGITGVSAMAILTMGIATLMGFVTRSYFRRR